MPPISTRSARSAGLRPYDLAKLVDAGVLWHMTRGMYLPAGHVGLAERAAAAIELAPVGSALSRATAAWLRGLDVLPVGVLDPTTFPVELTVPAGRVPPRRPGIRPYAAQLPPTDVEELHGLRMTTPLRTALDLGRYLPPLGAVGALDRFLAAGLVTPDELAGAAVQLAGRRNARLLRARIDMADPASESPGESWTRVRIIEAGLPRPMAQVQVIGPRGQRARLDLGYPQWRVGVEFDGEAHHTAQEDVAHDAHRRRWVEELGWELIVVRKHDVLVDACVRTWTHALAELLLVRGWDPPASELTELRRRLERAERAERWR